MRPRDSNPCQSAAADNTRNLEEEPTLQEPIAAPVQPASTRHYEAPLTVLALEDLAHTLEMLEIMSWYWRNAFAGLRPTIGPSGGMPVLGEVIETVPSCEV